MREDILMQLNAAMRNLETVMAEVEMGARRAHSAADEAIESRVLSSEEQRTIEEASELVGSVCSAITQKSDEMSYYAQRICRMMES